MLAINYYCSLKYCRPQSATCVRTRAKMTRLMRLGFFLNASDYIYGAWLLPPPMSAIVPI